MTAPPKCGSRPADPFRSLLCDLIRSVPVPVYAIPCDLIRSQAVHPIRSGPIPKCTKPIPIPIPIPIPVPTRAKCAQIQRQGFVLRRQPWTPRDRHPQRFVTDAPPPDSPQNSHAQSRGQSAESTRTVCRLCSSLARPQRTDSAPRSCLSAIRRAPNACPTPVRKPCACGSDK